MTVKILLSGDVCGNLAALSKRVAAVNKSNGPFNALFCAGGFFPVAGKGSEHDMCQTLSDSAPFPVPLYFIGAFSDGSETTLASLQDGKHAGNMEYLGRAGVRQIQGLTIAFLDGTYNKTVFNSLRQPSESPTCQHYTQADVNRLKAELRDAGDVDIFLTNEWPEGVQSGVIPALQPKGLNDEGIASPVLADLLLEVRPRYHIAGGRHVFWARVPYTNQDLGAGAHVTRFISLAEVGNDRKQKSLHALGLVPAKDQDIATLHQQPEGTTACPFTGSAGRLRRKADEALGTQDWRYQQAKRQKGDGAEKWGQADVVPDRRKTVFVRNLPFKASQADMASFFAPAGAIADIRRNLDDQGRLQGHALVQFESVEAAQRAAEMDGQDMMGRPQMIRLSEAPNKDHEPPPQCWFCLSSDAADTSLVVSIGEELYVAMDKGAISSTHVLLLPIEHVPSTLELSTAGYAELEKYCGALRECFKLQGLELVAFERFLRLTKSGGNHAHMNIIGVPARMGATAQQRFESMAGQHNFSFKPLAGGLAGEEARSAMKDVVGDGEFFSILLPDGSRLLHAIPRSEKHPISFGREVLAQLVGEPSRNLGQEMPTGIKLKPMIACQAHANSCRVGLGILEIRKTTC